MNMHASDTTLLVLGAVLGLAACQATQPETAGTAEPYAGVAAESGRDPSPETIVLATVNGRPLSLGDALDTFLSSHTGHGVLVRGEPAVRELAARLVERDLFLAEAESLGIPEDQLVHDVVAEYSFKTAEIAFWKREVDEQVHVPDEEVEAFYAKTDMALALSIIQAETREEAEALRARVVAGEDFEELAQASSTHASRSFGGSLPYMRRGELELALEDVAFALEEPGSLSEVIATEEGFAFLRLNERSENPTRPPREEALPQIRMILAGRLEDELRAEVEAEMAEGAGVEIDDSLLTLENVLGEDAPEAVVARAADETLTMGDLRSMLRLEIIRAVPEGEAGVVLRGITEEWTQNRAARVAVERSGLYDDPLVVEQVESFRRDVVLRVLYQQYVYADVEVDDEQVRAYYDEHREEEFTRPPEYRMAYIVLETEEQAREVQERIAAGDDFAELARERSIDPSAAAHGGRIGWVRPGTLLAEVEEVAFALEVGATSAPIATPGGYFVVQLMERKAAEPLSFGTSSSTARQRLTTELQKEAYVVWAVALRERAEATIHDEGIEQAVAWLEEEVRLREEAAAEQGPEAPGVLAPQAPPGHGAGGARP